VGSIPQPSPASASGFANRQGQEKEYDAVVKQLVRLSRPHSAGQEGGSAAADGEACVRIVVCDIYRHEERVGNENAGRLMFARHYENDPGGTFVHTDYAVLLLTLDTKLMHLPRFNRELNCIQLHVFC
jgi:hypothetical protein